MPKENSFVRKRSNPMETKTVPCTIVYYNLGPIERIPWGEGRTFSVKDTLIAVFRLRDGNVFATQAACPHRGGPLADGLVGAGKVICPLHAYAFALATGQPIQNSCEKLQTYPVSVDENGDIQLTLDIS
jgi:nitrite reductase (NADH) small subunit